MAAIDSQVVAVTTTAAILVTGDQDGTNFSLKNKTGEVLYIGPADVTADATAATGGYEVANDGEFSGRLDAGDKLYGVCATTGGNVTILTN